jgi:hypothetical protein
MKSPKQQNCHDHVPWLSFTLRWYFAVISVSGVFAVTFSVVFAYVADITQEHERSMAYGLVRILVLFLTCLPRTPFERRPY